MDTGVKDEAGIPSDASQDINVAEVRGNIAAATARKVVNGTDACTAVNRTSNTTSLDDATNRILATLDANRDILSAAASKDTDGAVSSVATDGAASRFTDGFVVGKDTVVTKNAVEGAAAATEGVSKAAAATEGVSRTAKWIGVAIAGVIIPTLGYVTAICYAAATEDVIVPKATAEEGSFLGGINVGDILAVVGGATVAVVSAPLLLPAMGFGAGGIAAGSIAACLQSMVGNVAAGSLFAALQSAGAAGLATSIQVGLGSAGAAVGAAVAYFF